MRLTIRFDSEWFYSDGGAHACVPAMVCRRLEKEFGDDISGLSSFLNVCSAVYTGELDSAALTDRVSAIAAQVSGCENLSGICEIKAVSDEAISEEASPEEASPGEALPAEDKQPAKAPSEPAIDLIHRRAGSRDFISLADEIHSRAKAILENESQKVFFSEAYLFAGDTGSGISSAVRLLASLLREDGLMEDEPEFRNYRVNEDDLKMLTEVYRESADETRVLVYDIGACMSKTSSPDFRRFLITLFKHNRKSLIVFRIPLAKPDVIRAVQADIEDVMTARLAVFDSFSPEELRKVAGKYLNAYDFTMDEAAWNAYDARIAREKKDGFFYGVQTVRKVVNECIRAGELRGSRTITAEDVLTGADSSAPEADALEELRQMVGMEPVYEQVKSIINRLEWSRANGKGIAPTMHMCFMGNPGTGKTTVARIIGRALAQRGVLRRGRFHEHHSRELCGKFVGETAPRTTAICEEAYGSVLFIDEAYSLASGSGDNDYGREAISTLIAQMENHSDDMIVIFAGYTEAMTRMIDMNAGLASRIPYMVSFPDYTRTQLAEIFRRLVKSDYEYEDGLFEVSDAYFASLSPEVTGSKNFGNGRYVRNIFERAWGKAVDRIGGKGRLVIRKEDFLAAVPELSGRELKRRTMGFGA